MRLSAALLLIALLALTGGCAGRTDIAEAESVSLATPKAAFHTAQRLLAEGAHALYCDRLLSRQSRAAAADRLAKLQKRIRQDPESAEFSPQLAELEARGVRTADLPTITARQFTIALLEDRYRRPPGGTPRPEPVIVGVVVDGEWAVLRYRLGPQSPITARMEFVREDGEWKTQEFRRE